MGDRSSNNMMKKGTRLWSLVKYNTLDDEHHLAAYTPEKLLTAFEDYSEYYANNPLKEEVLLQKTGEIIQMNKMRAMSVKAFCLYCGISMTTFLKYSARPEYTNICAAIKDAIYCQKFEGAAAGLLNPGVIVRDLGLNDNVNHAIVDERKSISDLFPLIEDVEAIEITDTKELPYGDITADNTPSK